MNMHVITCSICYLLFFCQFMFIMLTYSGSPLRSYHRNNGKITFTVYMIASLITCITSLYTSFRDFLSSLNFLILSVEMLVWGVLAYRAVLEPRNYKFHKVCISCMVLTFNFVGHVHIYIYYSQYKILFLLILVIHIAEYFGIWSIIYAPDVDSFRRKCKFFLSSATSKIFFGFFFLRLVITVSSVGNKMEYAERAYFWSRH
jgi:hypothetical protein